MPGVGIIGAGPGIGLSVARRFAREGIPVGVIARSHATVDAALAALADADVEIHGAAADAADEVALRAALDKFVDHFGVPDVLVYNAAIIQQDSIGDLSAAQHLDAWAVNVVGAITAAAHLVPRMAESGRGTYIITGGMPAPVPEVRIRWAPVALSPRPPGAGQRRSADFGHDDGHMDDAALPAVRSGPGLSAS